MLRDFPIEFVIAIAVAVGIAILAIILAMGYIKAPPDTAYIISGLRRKIIIGKASIRIPFFERVDKLKLQLIAVDVKTSSAVPTADYININVDANVNVKVSSDPALIKLGAENYVFWGGSEGYMSLLNTDQKREK